MLFVIWGGVSFLEEGSYDLFDEYYFALNYTG